MNEPTVLEVALLLVHARMNLFSVWRSSETTTIMSELLQWVLINAFSFLLALFCCDLTAECPTDAEEEHLYYQFRGNSPMPIDVVANDLDYLRLIPGKRIIYI